MEPYEQGALDGLCGIYSIINATRKVNKINEDKSSSLFNEIVNYYDNKWGFNKVILEGISLHDISQVLNDIIKSKCQIEAKAPFWHHPNTSLDIFWDEMIKFMMKNNTAILLGIGGVYDHWTVVESISEKQIKLFDSCRIKLFNRNRCTTQKPTSKRMHQIIPTHTYFLSKNST
jgi:hypothetical protein